MSNTIQTSIELSTTAYTLPKMDDIMKEIAQFLKPDARIDLKTVALQNIIGKQTQNLQYITFIDDF